MQVLRSGSEVRAHISAHELSSKLSILTVKWTPCPVSVKWSAGITLRTWCPDLDDHRRERTYHIRTYVTARPIPYCSIQLTHWTLLQNSIYVEAGSITSKDVRSHSPLGEQRSEPARILWTCQDQQSRILLLGQGSSWSWIRWSAIQSISASCG